MEGRTGPWVGVEVAELMGEKHEIVGLGDGSIAGIRYMSLGSPGSEDDETRDARKRKIEEIGQNLPGRRYDVSGRINGRKVSTNSLGLPSNGGHGGKRSVSPGFGVGGGSGGVSEDWLNGGNDGLGTKALFVRPQEVVFVVGVGE